MITTKPDWEEPEYWVSRGLSSIGRGIAWAGLSPEVALKAEKLSEGAVSKEKLIWGQAA